MKSMTRQQIAHRAGVSVKTLTNWCRPFRKELEALGLRPGMIVLPPRHRQVDRRQVLHRPRSPISASLRQAQGP